MAKDSPIQFKGTSLQIIQTQLASADPQRLHAGLAELTGNQPDFFENELAVLDFSAAESLAGPIDWAALVTLLRGSGLHAVATAGLPPALAEAAAAHGLPALAPEALARPRRAAAEPGRPRPEAAPAPAEAPPAAPEAPAVAPQPAAPPPPARGAVLDKPLRSGQRFYARGCDLVVLAQVSAGAEVIADGNIHVYAPLRGRALAGASGDRAARIFTTSLQAELVSVAGIYRTFEAGVPEAVAGQPASVALIERDGQATLVIEPLAIR